MPVNTTIPTLGYEDDQLTYELYGVVNEKGFAKEVEIANITRNAGYVVNRNARFNQKLLDNPNTGEPQVYQMDRYIVSRKTGLAIKCWNTGNLVHSLAEEIRDLVNVLKTSNREVKKVYLILGGTYFTQERVDIWRSPRRKTLLGVTNKLQIVTPDEYAVIAAAGNI